MIWCLYLLVVHIFDNLSHNNLRSIIFTSLDQENRCGQMPSSMKTNILRRWLMFLRSWERYDLSIHFISPFYADMAPSCALTHAVAVFVMYIHRLSELSGTPGSAAKLSIVSPAPA